MVDLECHSAYSFGEGTMGLEALVAAALASDSGYLSVTDTNGFYTLVRMLQRARDTGLKALIGSRLEKGKDSALLFAKNREGYAEICRLITRIHLEPDFDLGASLCLGPRPGVVLISRDERFWRAWGNASRAEINPFASYYLRTLANAEKARVAPVFIQPVYFRTAEDARLHKAVRAIHLRKTPWSLEPGECRDPRSHFHPRPVLEKKFDFLKTALDNTRALAEECFFDFEWGQFYFPDTVADADGVLASRTRAAIPKRYTSRDNDEEILARLDYELAIIRKKGFSNYFLVVEDIVREGGFYTCGRGSGAASIVSYLLFITHVDPIRHKLYFERFLNEWRPDPPDIDVDFAWDEKDRITQYVFDTYGERCAMVSNHNSFSLKSAFHEAAKLWGIPKDEIMALSRVWREDREDAGDNEKKETHPINRRKIFSRTKIPQWDEWIHLTRRLVGLPRYLGLHCGGMVVTPGPIWHYAPRQITRKGFPCLQWEKDQTEDFGLVKIDILGNRSLAVVRDTIDAVNGHYGLEIRYEHLDVLEDADTVAVFAAGGSLGVFYVESPAMRQLQKKTARGDYEHLVIHSSIIRPAANRFINEYVRRLKGGEWKPLLPEMKEILEETYGIMAYQEDISRVAVACAGFTIGEGDELRKVIGNKNRRRRKEELQKKFLENIRAKGVEEKIVVELWDMIESFSGYSFCKPHSASYAQLSFKACYLKKNFPAEFMAAVLSNRGGFYLPLAYVSEARRLGIAVATPCVNESRVAYHGKGQRIVIGLMAVRHLRAATMEKIVSEREKNGAYRSLRDFLKRVEVDIRECRSLIGCGAFAQIEKEWNEPQLMILAERFFHEAFSDALFQDESLLPPLKAWSEARRLGAEKRSLGFIASIHPMTYYRRFV
ncbi:MAG: DNA polymerase III subunit alpha, partial [Spirochaetia bacterium]|nr:DNA polymerase III subunit alpha [Spirochaetia bacterium]